MAGVQVKAAKGRREACTADEPGEARRAADGGRTQHAVVLMLETQYHNNKKVHSNKTALQMLEYSQQK